MAQDQALLISLEQDENSLGPESSYPTHDTIGRSEIAWVRPTAGAPFAARTFLSLDASWTYVGDIDNNSSFVEPFFDAPFDLIDAIMVKRFPAAVQDPGPQDVYFSFRDANTLQGFTRNDVIRLAGEGVIDVFMSDAQLRTALGVPSSFLNLIALCQDDLGNVYVAVNTNDQLLTESLIMIPSSAITYDAQGNIQSILSNSAIIVASGDRFCNFVENAGLDEIDISGTILSAVIDCSSLGFLFRVNNIAINPAGGTWVAPSVPQPLPNLLFTVALSRYEGVFSTANNGSFAVVNGTPLASNTTPIGIELGLDPDGDVELRGLEVVETPQPLTVQTWPSPTVGPATAVLREEVSGATPGGAVLFIYDRLPELAGTFAPSQLVGSNITNPLFGDGGWVYLGAQTADTSGFASLTIPLTGSVLTSNHHLVVQAFDVTTLTFSTPGTIDF